MAHSEELITDLLKAWQNGNESAQDELFKLIYPELRKIAQKRLNSEGRQHTLQATELVHEVFPQLARQHKPWQNRSQFFAIASECMRRFLVDYARTRQRQKRGGSKAFQVSFSDINPTEICRIENYDEILAVDRALEKLHALDETQALIIKHRYFGGLAREEIAEILEVSPATIDRNYRVAKAWLRRELAFQFSPYLLQASQVRNPQIFIGHFLVDSENPFALHLRASLPTELLGKLDALKSDVTISFNLLPELIENLNKLLMGNDIFPPFLIEKLGNKASSKENSSGLDELRRNRQFFEEAFPNEFVKIVENH